MNSILRILAAVAMLFAFAGQLSAHAKPAPPNCMWEGKAPACNGKCRSGYEVIKNDKAGDGKKCVTGNKVLCCKSGEVITRGTAPACNGKCKPGEITVGESNKGPNGERCITGKAALCMKKIE